MILGKLIFDKKSEAFHHAHICQRFALSNDLHLIYMYYTIKQGFFLPHIYFIIIKKSVIIIKVLQFPGSTLNLLNQSIHYRGTSP